MDTNRIMCWHYLRLPPNTEGLIIKFIPNIFSSRQSSREAYEIGELGKKGSGISWKDDATASTKITASKKKHEDDLEIEESKFGLAITKTIDVNVSSLKDGSSNSL